MTMHRLWAGTLLVLAATGLEVSAGGGWTIALIALLGTLLVLTSFAERRAA